MIIRKRRKVMTLVFLGIILSAFIMSEIYQNNSSSTIDQYPYEVMKSYDDFEVRKYKSAYFNTVELSSNDYENVSTKGFRILAGYIFGANDEKRTIAMTSPVVMNMEENVTMKFMVPLDENPEQLPTPNASNIKLEKVPEQTMAAISFGGWASNEKIQKYADQLKNSLDEKGLKYYNNYSFYGYNPPFQVFGRRNEVVIELINY